jgi:hypothetical protein
MWGRFFREGRGWRFAGLEVAGCGVKKREATADCLGAVAEESRFLAALGMTRFGFCDVG